jgi:hypothetical protein
MNFGFDSTTTINFFFFFPLSFQRAAIFVPSSNTGGY